MQEFGKLQQKKNNLPKYFLKFPVWKYPSPSEKENIGKAILPIIFKISGPPII